jgi:choice-of-anchor A domain-containing protein
MRFLRSTLLCAALAAPQPLIASSSGSGSGSGPGAGPFGPASAYDLWGTNSLYLLQSGTAGRLYGSKTVEVDQFYLGTGSWLTSTDDVVVSGGELVLINGAVANGQGVYGTTVQMAPSVHFQNAVMWPRQEDLHDDDLIREGLEDQSVALGLLPPTGDAFPGGSVLNLVGYEPGLNVFLVPTRDLEGVFHINLIVPPGASVLVNTEGGIYRPAEWSPTVTGVPASKVLFNAYEASRISFGSGSFDGSILAPHGTLDLNNLAIQGQMIARHLRLKSCQTSGGALEGDEFVDAGCGYALDETGLDKGTYSLVWKERTPGETVEVRPVGTDALELVVNGSSCGTMRRDRVTRVVYDGHAAASSLVDPALNLPVERTSQAPVAMDDRGLLLNGATQVTVDVLANDLPSTVPLDPTSVQIVSGPLSGSVSVDPATGAITYTAPQVGGVMPTIGAPWHRLFVWYTVRDQNGVSSTPRRLLIVRQDRRGLRRR